MRLRRRASRRVRALRSRRAGFIIRWRNPGESDDEKPGEDEWKPPTYGGGRRDDIIDAEATTPPTMIEHAAAEPEPAEQPPAVEASEPAPAVVEPAPASAVARYEREQVDSWIRARLTAYPVDRCCHCRLPFVVGQQWQEAADDAVRVRFHAACHLAWRSEREAAARQALGLEG
jgi:hypothetical protein